MLILVGTILIDPDRLKMRLAYNANMSLIRDVHHWYWTRLSERCCRWIGVCQWDIRHELITDEGHAHGGANVRSTQLEARLIKAVNWMTIDLSRDEEVYDQQMSKSVNTSYSVATDEMVQTRRQRKHTRRAPQLHRSLQSSWSGPSQHQLYPPICRA